MHLSTLACLLVCFIPLTIRSVFPTDDVFWWRDADSNPDTLPWYKRGENEELFPKSWIGTDKRIEWVLTVQVIHVFEQLSWNPRGLCYDRVVAAGYPERALRGWKEFLGGIFTSRMKAVGFNFRENVTEAYPPLNTRNGSEMLKHWIKTKILAKSKHWEIGGVCRQIILLQATCHMPPNAASTGLKFTSIG